MEETSWRKHEKDWFKERKCSRSMQVEKRCKSCRSSGMHPATSSHWGLNWIKTGLMMLMMFAVSNALLMSKATATVHCRGLILLKLFVIWWQMLCKAVFVKCYAWIHVDEKWLKCFLLCMVIMFFLVFWQWVIEVTWIGSLCNVVVFI